KTSHPFRIGGDTLFVVRYLTILPYAEVLDRLIKFNREVNSIILVRVFLPNPLRLLNAVSFYRVFICLLQRSLKDMIAVHRRNSKIYHHTAILIRRKGVPLKAAPCCSG